MSGLNGHRNFNGLVNVKYINKVPIKKPKKKRKQSFKERWLRWVLCGIPIMALNNIGFIIFYDLFNLQREISFHAGWLLMSAFNLIIMELIVYGRLQNA